MSYQLFQLPKQTNIDSSVRVVPGAKAYFYETLTSNLQDTFTTSALNVAHQNPVVADANGVFPAIYLDPSLVYKLTLNTSADSLIYTVDPCNDNPLSAAGIGAALYPRTATEIAVGVTPVNYAYPPGYVYRYGTNTTPGTTDMAAAIQAAIDVATVAGGKVTFASDIHLISDTIDVKSFTHLEGTFGESGYPATLANGGTAETGTRIVWGGAASAITFTGNVATATSGTLTSAITNGVYNFTFYNSVNTTLTCEQRKVTVTGGTSCSWTTALASGTITSGITGASVLLSCFNARLFSIRGIVLDGADIAGTVCILLDCANNPSGSQNEIHSFSLRNFSIGVQWGTSGLANGSYANDGTRFSTFTAWSDVANSIGFVLNSGNAAQMSTIESGGIQVDLMGIDIKICNQLQIRRVFVGGRVTLAGIRTSVAIDSLIEGCDFENHGPSGGLISASSYSLLVIPQVESYPVSECVLMLKGNKLNNPVSIGASTRIMDMGNTWGQANGASFPTVSYIPSTGAFTAGTSYLVALNPGANSQTTYGWQRSAFVQMVHISPEGGISFTGSLDGYTDSLASSSTTNNGLLGISTKMTGAPVMHFDHRATSNTGSFSWRNGTGGGTTLLSLSGAGRLAFGVTPADFADDAAASAGGVPVGGVYRTASVLKVRVA